MIEVMIVDDNPIVRAALRDFLHSTEEAEVVAEAGNGLTAVDTARRLHPAVTLLDYRMPIADGLSVISELSGQSAVLVLTSDADPDLIAEMLRRGARGYLVHGEFEPDELLRAVTAVANGQGWLSPVAASAAASALREQLSSTRSQVEQNQRDRLARARFGLTQREEDILALLCEGLSNAAIGRRLVVAEKTVKNHLYHIFAKLQVSSRTEAVARWTGRG